MIYTKSYFDGVESLLLPMNLEQVEDDSAFEAVYTVSLDYQTRLLVEAFLLIQNEDDEEYREQREFLKIVKETGSDFVSRCLKMSQRFRMLKGYNTTKLELIFFICQNASYILEDSELLRFLENCSSDVEASEHLTQNFLKKEIKDTVYYVKEYACETPACINTLATYTNKSLERPVIVKDTAKDFGDFPVDLSEEITGFFAVELKKVLHKLIDQMIISDDCYRQLVKMGNVPVGVQRYMETLALEHRCKNLSELIIKIEEVLR